MSSPRPGARAVVTRAVRRTVAPFRSSAVLLFEGVLGVRTYGEMLQTGWVALWALFRQLEVGEDDSFADLGSAKGRVLYMAARKPFKRVLGVDRSAEFNRTARANLVRTRRGRRAGRVEVEDQDLRDWAIPPDITVFYVFTPLDRDLFEALIHRIEESARNTPRRIRLLYLLPEDIDPLLFSWRVERLRDVVPRYVRHRFYERASIATLEPHAAVRSGG